MQLICMACLPAARRTPAASVITTTATTKLMANSELLKPLTSPMEVDNALTIAECELGMPPSEKSSLAFRRFSRTPAISTLIACATNHASTPTHMIRLENSSSNTYMGGLLSAREHIRRQANERLRRALEM